MDTSYTEPTAATEPPPPDRPKPTGAPPKQDKLAGKELTHAGKQAKAHIEAAERHAGKAREQYIAAGRYLADAKRSVPRGEWLQWLGKYGIAPRTASRCMLTYQNPSSYDEANAAEAERQRTQRSYMADIKAAEFPDTSRRKPRDPMAEHDPTTTSPATESDRQEFSSFQWQRYTDAIGGLIDALHTLRGIQKLEGIPKFTPDQEAAFTLALETAYELETKAKEAHSV